ncbi:MAG TPA: hypothetical protein VK897_00830 [Anaerolineales bacterium]|nr:hypothetical protein [Anaerolineales bacterium]
MLPDLSSRLSKLVEQKRLKKKLEQDLQSVETELQEKSAQFATLEVQLEKENVDVKKLERTSLTALFYSVLGSREEQLEKERQELLSAQLRYQQMKRQVESLQQEQNSLRGRLDQLAGIESKYELLLAEKEGILRGSNQMVARELVELSDQMANLNAETKELTEAITAGNDVIASLKNVIASLESAEGWGTWDLLGGGVISTAIKHSRIDEARENIHDVQVRMSRFHRELADVREHVDLQIDIGEFTSFADYFFDGLIVDWIVQSKIVESLERSKQAKSLVAQTVKELEDHRMSAQNRKDDLQRKRALLIERA